jgi:hypothetical protein
MNQTIRDYLRGRVALIKPAAIGGVLLCIFLLFQVRGDKHHPAPGDLRFYFGVLAVVTAVLGVQFWSQARLKCPRCGSSLSTLALLLAYAPRRVPSCPHCGVSFDEPYAR